MVRRTQGGRSGREWSSGTGQRQCVGGGQLEGAVVVVGFIVLGFDYFCLHPFDVLLHFIHEFDPFGIACEFIAEFSDFGLV